MNRRARAMGLTCTHFSAPDGFTDRANHSCAADLAALARAVLREPRLARIVRRRQAVLPFPIKGGKIYLYNHNPLLRQGYRGVTGIKTGYTVAAGRCLVATVRRGQVRLGVVLLHSPDPGDARRASCWTAVSVSRASERVCSAVANPPLSPSVYRRRRFVAVLIGVAVLAVAALLLRGGGSDERPAGGREKADGDAREPPQLPGGGRRLLPDRRIVAFYGAPQAAELGQLGIGTPASAARKLAKQARGLPSARPAGAAGDGADRGGGGRAPGRGRALQHARQSRKVIDRYLRAARRAKALLILDIQPGRSDFFTEAQRLRRWLKEPDVGLALDPEWRMGPGQVPGNVIGSVEAREVNATSAWLAQLVKEHDLPEKLFLIHQFTDDMVDDTPAAGAPRPLDGAQRRRLRRPGDQEGQVPRLHALSARLLPHRASSSSTARTRTS